MKLAGASSQSESTMFGENETGIKDKRSKLLGIFRQRHGFIPPLENQPSESTLSHLVKLHEKRSAEFFPLSRVTNFADGRDIKIEPTKIKGTPLCLTTERFL